MTLRARSAFVLLAGVLAACGGKESSAPVNAGPSDISTGSSAPAVTLHAVVTTSVPPTYLPATTEAPSTTVAPVPTAAPSNPAGAEYAPAPAPVYPEHSSPPPSGDGLPDGLYYAVATAASADPGPHVTVAIYEMLTGAAAIAAATADGVGLDSDVYVRSMSFAERPIDLTPTVAISVARADKPGTSYAVSGAELVRLLGGDKPGAGAPAGYQYVPFPFLVTVQGGLPSRVEQLWSP